jgi:hypothetical protein
MKMFLNGHLVCLQPNTGNAIQVGDDATNGNGASLTFCWSMDQCFEHSFQN